jgi:NAD-dependent deacetylase
LVIVNQGETPLDDRADTVLRDPIGEVLPRIVSAK